MNIFYVAGIPYSDELYHHGIKGQKWGIRRFQNKDGTLTEAGLARYRSGSEQKKLADKLTKNIGSWGSYKRMSNNNAVTMKRQVKHAIQLTKDKTNEASEYEKQFREKEFEFYNDKETYEKYLRKVVDKSYEDYGKGYGLSKEQLLKDFRDYDLDQGQSLDLYMQSNEPKAKELLSIKRAGEKAYKDAIKSAETYADEFLGEYGNQTVNDAYHYGGTSTAKERLSRIISDEAFNQSFRSPSDRLAYSKRRNY